MGHFGLYLLLGVSIVNSGLFIERLWRMHQGTFQQTFFTDPVYRWSNILIPMLIVPITLTIMHTALPHFWILVVLQASFVLVALGKMITGLVELTKTAYALGVARSFLELLIHMYMWSVVWPIL